MRWVTRARGIAVVAALSLVTTTFAIVFPALAAEPGLGRFRTVCDHSHFRQVDPIVNPGPSGTPSHHMHEFAANRSTDSDSTYESMVSAGTSCELGADSAGYWVPALVGPGGQLVAMDRMTAYYSNRPVMASGQETISFPPDFRMIAAASYPHSYWNCVGDSDHSMSSRHMNPPDCGSSQLRLHIFFPSCWDGRLDSADHKSHVAYGYRDGSVYGSPGATEDYRIDACPSTHPLKIPQVRYRIIYPVSDGAQYTLADGTRSAHADFWNTWDQPTLDALTDQVLNSAVVTPDIHDDNIDQFVDLSIPPAPSPPSVSVVASDPDASEEDTDPGAFTVTRSGPTSDPLTVSYALGGTATQGIDFVEPTGSVVIAAGASSAEVPVTPIDDSDPEEPETVLLSLVGGSGYAVASPNSGVVTIADNDGSPPTLPDPPPPAGPPTVTVSASDSDASEEGGDPGTFNITRTGSTSEALTVHYDLGGSADDADFTGLNGSVVVPVGAADIDASVIPVDDTAAEDPETVVLTLSVDPAYEVGSPASATVTIADNDTAPPPPPQPPPSPPAPGPITFVGRGAVSSEQNAFGTDGQTVGLPTVANGDFMLLVSHRNDDKGDFVTPSGWTRLGAIDGGVSSGEARQTMIAWRVADSEPSKYTIIHTDDKREQWSSVIVAWRGVDNSQPFDVAPAPAHYGTASRDPSPSHRPIVTLNDEALVVLVSAITHDDIDVGEAPAGYTMRVDHTGASLDHRQIQIADRSTSDAGAATPGNWLNTTIKPGHGDASTATIALRPASASAAASLTMASNSLRIT